MSVLIRTRLFGTICH